MLPTFVAGSFLEFLRTVSAIRNGICALRRLAAIHLFCDSYLNSLSFAFGRFFPTGLSGSGSYFLPLLRKGIRL